MNAQLSARIPGVNPVLRDIVQIGGMGERYWRQVLVSRARIQGFLVIDYQARYGEARDRLAGWVRDGLIKQRFDIAEGLERTPDAFIRLLTSQNQGKQLVGV